MGVEKPDNTKRNRLVSTATAAAIAAGAIGGGTEYEQRHINKANAEHNHAFTIDELDLPTKIRHLIGTTAYGNRYSEALSKKFPSMAGTLRNDTKGGLVHLYRGEMSSLEGARESINEIRVHANNPVFISADIEGGVINHFRFKPEDLRRFGIPGEILAERNNEYAFNLKLHKGDTSKVRNAVDFPLPSQEWLGRKYDSLKKPEDRKEFLRAMEGYGQSIAKICEYVGINMVFGPNLDIVENIDGNKPDEHNDRSYGEDPRTVRDLADAYIRGFQKVPSVLAIPKHFVGNSLATTDPHTGEARVDIPARSGALLPYRDIINASNAETRKSDRLSSLDEQISTLREKTQSYQERLKNLEIKSKEYKPLERTVAANNRLLEQWQREREKVADTPVSDLPTGGIMTSVVSTGLYGQKRVPVTYSNAIRDRLKAPKDAGGLGHTGITITDDLSMGASTDYIKELAQKKKDKQFDPEALAVHQALSAGNEIAFVKDIAGREDVIASEVAEYIREKTKLHARNGADLSEKDVNVLLKKVLDLKVQVGLLSKQIINGKEYYVMDPKFYNPTTAQVLLNSAFSNQLPWTSKDLTPETSQPNSMRLMYKAVKNFGLSLLRVSFPTVEGRFRDAETNRAKLILVDKSAHHLWIYDNESRKLEREFDVGIGMGGVGERRFVGDHRTPTGVYEVVQKRDDTYWRNEKGQPLPEAYGGIEGGMLVLAGQWHPEIAIHGHGKDAPQLGEVSNGCVRVENADIDELLHSIPIGTMVIITK